MLFTSELARRFAATGITVNAADPGFVRTRLGRDAPGVFGVFLHLIRTFQLSPAKAADAPVHLATSADVAEVTGEYFVKRRSREPGKLARDSGLARQLWDLSARLTSHVG